MPGHNVSPFASPLPISPQLQLQNLFSDGCLLLQASAVCLRAPVSESLSRLQRDQLQKFAQYLISELPQQVGEVGTSHCWLSGFASGLFSAFLFHTGLFGFTCALFSLPLFFPPQILPTPHLFPSILAFSILLFLDILSRHSLPFFLLLKPWPCPVYSCFLGSELF